MIYSYLLIIFHLIYLYLLVIFDLIYLSCLFFSDLFDPNSALDTVTELPQEYVQLEVKLDRVKHLYETFLRLSRNFTVNDYDASVAESMKVSDIVYNIHNMYKLIVHIMYILIDCTSTGCIFLSISFLSLPLIELCYMII